jgi:hypothetical protein
LSAYIAALIFTRLFFGRQRAGKVTASILFAALAIITHTGCARASHKGDSNLTEDDPKRRLSATFSAHNFGPYCFDTLECRIEYDGQTWLNETSRRPPLDERAEGNLRGSIAGIVNFPTPAKISWRSLDGETHHADIDIACIFHDRRIVHSPEISASDVPERAYFGDPDVIIVVNDRTVSVYMKAFIPLKHTRVHGNPHSNYRDEAILAWTKDF